MMHTVKPAAPLWTDPDNLDKNSSGNPTMDEVLAARLHRRHVLKGGVGAMAAAGLGALGLTACSTLPSGAGDVPGVKLGFKAVNKSLMDRITIAPGYTASVVYATGDPLDAALTDYKNDGNDDNFARRSGDHHDGMHYFGLNAAGQPDSSSLDRALLVMNHENITGTVKFLHVAGQTNIAPTAGPRPESEVVKEIDAHGVSIVELRRVDGKYSYLKSSSLNRRITGATPMELSGPARGSAYTRTLYSRDGTKTRGTVNNCANGVTPWGTYLTCEENWAGYFIRRADTAARSPRENSALLRNGIRPGAAGFAHNRWASVVAADAATTAYSRWDCSALDAKAADGTGDFRNEPNTFGYVVEIDPYNPNAAPVKRTALGRRSNEGASVSIPAAGKPLAFYIGCDSRGEYIYKYVSTKLWTPGDANRADRMQVGAEYMDDGSIYAARFNANGTGNWVKLDLSNPDVAAGVPASVLNPEGYKFENKADICVNTRLAADAAKATRMDRPEWTAVNPKNGEIYITLTENPDRGNTTTTSNNNFTHPDVDAANPRYWNDTKGVTSQNAAAIAAQRGNVNGHIMRIREDGDNAGAETFKWDIFLFGSQAVADAGVDDVNWQKNVNLSGLSPLNDLSKPDGCWFSRASGILWVQTDDNTFTDQSNCMLLAAVPGNHGDGGPVTVVNKPDGSPNRAVTAEKNVTTYRGRKMTDVTFKRFLTAPVGAEVTGLAESPDGKALFINIQHPGENTTGAQFTNKIFESNWPANGGGVVAYGPGGASARPRSATVVITKDDGGVIGL